MCVSLRKHIYSKYYIDSGEHIKATQWPHLHRGFPNKCIE